MDVRDSTIRLKPTDVSRPFFEQDALAVNVRIH